MSKLAVKINELCPMSADSIDTLESCFEQVKLGKDECLLKAGMICIHLYYVEKGSLRAFYSKAGKEVNINFTLENNFTSNFESLKSKESSEYTIAANIKTVLWRVNNDKLIKLFSESPEIENFGRAIASMLLKDISFHANLLALHSPRERYDVLVQYNPLFIKDISLTQLASYLGVARETLSRIRKIKT